MSPRHNTSRGSLAEDGSVSLSVIPFLFTSSLRYSSCTLRKSSPAGRGGRIFIRLRSRFFCLSSSSGIFMSLYCGSSDSSSFIRYSRFSSWVIFLTPPLSQHLLQHFSDILVDADGSIFYLIRRPRLAQINAAVPCCRSLISHAPEIKFYDRRRVHAGAKLQK